MKMCMRFAAVAMMTCICIGLVSAADLSVGFKGGLNLTRFSGSDINNPLFANNTNAMKPGLGIGIAWDIRLAKFFSLQPEILYAMKGSKGKVTGYIVDGAVSIPVADSIKVNQLNYIEIPILCKLTFPIKDIVVPNVYMAPVLGIRAGAWGYTTVDGEKTDRMGEEKIEALKDRTNLFDFGLAVGGGTHIRLGRGSAVVDCRYTLGLTQIARLTDARKDAGFGKDVLPKDKNSAISIMVGYLFAIGE